MSVVEAIIAVVLALGGMRSLWIWGRRHFESTKASDHALYALYLTGRIGLWFAFAGFFAIYASIDRRGVGVINQLEEFRWYALVPIVLASMQLLAGVALARRSTE